MHSSIRRCGHLTIIDETVDREIPTVPRRGALRRSLHEPEVIVPAAMLLLIAIACLAAPLITSQSPTYATIENSLAGMSGAHPLGTDGVGRDVLARLLYGGRSSLSGALIAVLVAVAVGGPLGLIAGYFRGWFDSALNWVLSLLMAVPAIIILLVVLPSFGGSMSLAMVVFGVLLSPAVFRLVRGAVIAIRGELYIDAARVSGLSDVRILRRHVLRVVVAPIIVLSAQLFGIGIIIQAGLQFLGLGNAAAPSWGAMLTDAFTNIYQRPALMIWPAAAIVLSVVLASLLANGVRDLVQSRGRTRAVPKRRQVPVASTDPAAQLSAADSEPSSLLRLHDLHIAYAGREVVRGVSLDIRQGEVLGIVGETGSGKSQTAFSILGLLPSDAEWRAASLSFQGEELQRLSERRMNAIRGRRIGYVPQDPMTNLDPCFTIGSQLIEPIRQHLGLSTREARDKAASLLDRVGIAEPARVLRSYPHELSGGMAQRVLIAGAVSCDPDLIIADEPTTALDVTVQAEVLELLRSLQQERHMAMLLVTHDLGVVADICDRVIVMRFGEVIESNTVAELFAEPKHPFTRSLLAATLADVPARQPLLVGAVQ